MSGASDWFAGEVDCAGNPLTIRVEELQRYLRLMVRNLEAGDSRMLRENIACLLFRSKHGRDPGRDELPHAFASLTIGEQQS